VDDSLINLVRPIPCLSGIVDAGQEKVRIGAVHSIVCDEVCDGALRCDVIRSTGAEKVRYARPTLYPLTLGQGLERVVFGGSPESQHSPLTAVVIGRRRVRSRLPSSYGFSLDLMLPIGAAKPEHGA